jgi:hypothetical protein
MAKAITSAGYENMSVTHLAKGEYGSASDILRPIVR